MSKRILRYLFIIFLFGSGSFAYGQAIVHKPVLLKQGTIKTYNNVSEWAARQSKYPTQVFVQFAKLPSASQKESLAQSGTELVQYIPENTWVAIVSKKADAQVLQSAGAIFVTDVNPGWKQGPALQEQLNTAQEMLELSVSFLPVVDEPEAIAFINSLGGRIIANRIQSMGYCNLAISKKDARILIDWYGVSYADVYTPDAPLNLDTKTMYRGKIASAPPASGGYGLTGKGVTIGVGDNTSGIFHVDLMDRIVNFNAMGYTNHGVHIN
ncbi:MAG TPA: hypothetical protein VIN07_07520, partial [Flavipsychrobacter sp.]